MSTFTKLSYHVVFGTKLRRPVITTFRERLYEYTGGIVRGLNGALLEIGGVADHVHLLVNLPPSRSVSDCLRDIKANSSKWVNESRVTAGRFEWQQGYGAFTVSYSQLETVRHYIQNQAKHHRVRSFQEEYLELLTRHGIEFDMKYVFEAEYVG
jgi:REP element-mobilizing transposase RayT